MAIDSRVLQGGLGALVETLRQANSEKRLSSMESNRQRKALAEKLRGGEAAFRGISDAPASALVGSRGGGGTTIGGVPINMPEITGIDYSGPLAQLGSAYMAKRQGGQAQEAEQAYGSEQANMQDQMLGEFQSASPEEGIQRLGAMAQVGVPGAKEALARALMEKQTPKADKNTLMTTFIQNLRFMSRSPSAIKEAARAAGISEEQAMAMANEFNASEDKDFERKMKLLDLRGEQAAGLAKTKADLRPAITPGQTNTYTKQADESRARVESADRALGEIATAKKIPASNFNLSNRIAGLLATSDNPWISGVGGAMLSPEQQQLYRVTIPTTLEDLRKLGGSDTEAEYTRIQRQYPNLIMNYEQFQSAINSMERALTRDKSNATERFEEANQALGGGMKLFSTSNGSAQPPTSGGWSIRKK